MDLGIDKVLDLSYSKRTGFFKTPYVYLKKKPLDAPDKTKPEHFKKSILYVGWQWMINNGYLFFSIALHTTLTVTNWVCKAEFV